MKPEPEYVQTWRAISRGLTKLVLAVVVGYLVLLGIWAVLVGVNASHKDGALARCEVQALTVGDLKERPRAAVVCMKGQGYAFGCFPDSIDPGSYGAIAATRVALHASCYENVSESAAKGLDHFLWSLEAITPSSWTEPKRP
jgi:hypothetical protein